MENEKKKTLKDVMDSLAELAESAEKVADLEKRLSKAADNAAQMAKRIASLENENEALRADRAMLRNFRGEAYAMLNGILLAIDKLKCLNASIN
ncbi:hypothetical protein SAMN05720469_1622 [Fibrobacter intestinalis]|uniref:Cell division protein ZapB n=1 Tax=Fibrobacter intestinalis TaxID=28122 RepID=A0A1M6ZHG0_9BACT|nr:hypothetical protein [Fibrobacter intestinalis]SHL29938.1 hypothetical protein SAMN05720469_1622 [Fibrobacter intestinalis]